MSIFIYFSASKISIPSLKISQLIQCLIFWLETLQNIPLHKLHSKDFFIRRSQPLNITQLILGALFFGSPGTVLRSQVISYNGDEWLEMAKVMGLANFEGQ